MSLDLSHELQQQLEHCIDNNIAVNICGHGSKQFYGRRIDSSLECLDISKHQGIISYQPTELVITARSGTPISMIETVLAEKNQMLAFEPPQFNGKGSLGGMVACGLSGPARPFAGAVRDAVLGVNCINGKAEKLVFGGQVMKNVAGYDISRLMTGSMGTLGVLLDVSIKVMPKPEQDITLVLEQDIHQSLATWEKLGNQALVISASCQLDDQLYIRLSGNHAAVRHAQTIIGGTEYPKSSRFWQQFRDHELEFFNNPRPLWRLSLAPATMPLNIHGSTLTDWAGAQRWVKTDETADIIRQLCASHGGHATLFNPTDNSIEAFHPLKAGVAILHKQLKQAFDPAGILNPLRMTVDY